MTKYIGVDYGKKFVGLAVSDDSGTMAFPREVVETKDAMAVIMDLIKSEDVTDIVMGHSLRQDGKENTVAKDARSFSENFPEGLRVRWQDERFSSLEASRYLYDNRPIANPRRKEHKEKRDDDSAAAIILQRFLDKQKK